MGKQVSSKSIKQKIERVLIVLFSAIVAGVVLVYLFTAYEPSMNSARALGSVCMDVICILLLLILVLGIVFDRPILNLTTKLFLILMLGTMFGLFFDFLNWAADGALTYNNWTYFATMASLCTGSVLAGILALYLSSYIDDMYGIKSGWIRGKICACCNVVAFVLALTLAITKQAFEFVDGHYELGALYDVITVIPLLTVLYMLAFAVRHVKQIGGHDLIAIAGFLFFMIAGVVIEASYGIGATYVAVAVADVFIFVMLQNKLIAEVQKKAEEWMQKSNMDEMTGFYNRNAYEEEIHRLDGTELSDNFVYVSMDVNGLKEVNDSLGHDIGDELIVGASECIKQCFGAYGKLYRTGGDEFVGLIYADDNQLEEIKKDFDELTEGLTVSCGYVTQKESAEISLHQMAVLADKKMYEAKTQYYRKRGVNRRGQRDAHVALCALYSEILKINVTEDSYQIVNVQEDVLSTDQELEEKYTERVNRFVESGYVHPDDVAEFVEKMSSKYISKHFKIGFFTHRVFYRRKHADGYHNTIIEIIPANDYEMNSQSLYLYVKDLQQ